MADGFMGGLLGGGAGSVIGGSVVRLFLDDSQFNRSLAQAQAKNKTASGSMAGGWAKFSMVGQAAAVAVGVALVKFAASAVTAAREADAMQRKLANSIANSTTVTEAAIPVFQAQAQAIRDLTGVDDDAINSMQAFLVQMHLTQDQVTQLTPTIVDLSVKMGISLEAAAKAVGKSVNGTTAGLQRMGVVVDKDAAKTDAFGATLTALGVVAGFAAKEAKAEPWRLLGMQWEELQEKVGHLLLPALKELAEAALELVDVIGPGLVTVFEQIAVGANALATNVRILTGDFTALTDVNLGLLGDILKLNPATAAFGDAVGYLGERQEQQAANEKAIQDAYDKGIPLLADIRHANEAYGDSVQATGRKIHHFAGMAGKDLKDFKKDVKSNIEDTFGSISSFDRRWNLSSQRLGNVLAGMKDKLKTFNADLKELKGEEFGPKTEKFKAWLLQQGPDAVHAFEGATRTAKEHMVADWIAMSGEQAHSKRIIDGIATGLKNLPTEKTIDIYIRTHVASSHFPGVDAAIADAIRHRTEVP